jgi:thioredoxin reductase (NADPH)
MVIHKVLIIGSGPAGLTAAIYAARAALQPIVLEGLQPGGQLTTTSIVENFPGFAHGIDGTELMNNMRQQAESMGALFETCIVENITETGDGTLTLHMDNGTTKVTQTVIVASGAKALTLGLPREWELMGRGVSTCATCDGFFYRNKVVAVVGGGDSAMEEAHYLAKLAKQVYLVHRRQTFKASQAMVDKVKHASNITLVLDSVITDTVETDGNVSGIIVKNIVTNTQQTIGVDGLFMAIGHAPNTEFVKQLGILKPDNTIQTIPGSTATQIAGLFAAGDVEDSVFRQAITSAGRGCQAALEVQKFIEHAA